MVRKRRRRTSDRKCFIVAVSICLVSWVRSRRSALWIQASVCHEYAKPASKYERARLGIFAFLGKKISYSSEAGFCLCERRFTTAHRACPKIPVDCASECRLAKAIVSPRARTLNKPLVQCKELLRSHHPRDEILHLFGELLDAVQTPKMNVHNLPGLRRKISDDFVARGERLAPIDVIRLKHAKNDFMRHVPSLEHGTFRGGRGVVMVASAREIGYSTGFWLAVLALRRAGCALPIELWFPSGEFPACEQIQELQTHGVDIRSFTSLGLRNGFDGRFSLKILALVASDFEEVLAIDADNIAITNVCELFDTSEGYTETGALLWRDFWASSVAPDVYDILELAKDSLFHGTHESGQMLIHKTKVWPALALAVFFNAHASHVWSPLAGNYLGWGDKELLYLAMVATGTRFSRVPRLPLHVGVRTATRTAVFGNSMLQFTPDGRTPAFMHANIGKITAQNFPSDFSRYQRRWIDADADVNITALLSRATGEIDFERWVFNTVRRLAPLVARGSSRRSRAWHDVLDLERAPLLEGLFLDDHAGLMTSTRSLHLEPPCT